MNKQELIEAVAAHSGESKAAVGRVVDSLSDVVTAELAKGSEVTFGSLGRIVVAQRAAKTGRNPQTGQSIEIPASKTAKLKPSKAVKDALN